jgi:hypothetical protein
MVLERKPNNRYKIQNKIDRIETFFNFKNVLLIYLILVTIYRAIILLYLIKNGMFHVNMYTYWNYTLLWIFDILYFIGVLIEGKFLKYITLYIYPIIHGSNFLVFSIIIIVIELNDSIFIKGTIYAGGNIKIGDIHTGDYIVHVLPLIETLLIMLFGLLFYVRAILYHFKLHVNYKYYQYIYLLYWILSPLIPITIYSFIFNPFIQYPTSLHKFTEIIILLILCMSYMIFTYIYLITSTRFKINLNESCNNNNNTYINKKEHNICNNKKHNTCINGKLNLNI